MLGQKCHRCGKGMTKDNPPSVDHVRAIAAGGSWTGPFQVICRSCNSSKRDKPDVGKGA